MVFSTREMAQVVALVTRMQTGLETLMTANQLQVTYSYSLVALSLGKAKSRDVLHYQQLKLNKLLWLVLHKSQYGSGS